MKLVSYIMTIYSKFNNIDDDIRNEKVKKIYKIIRNKIDAYNFEKDVYNQTIIQTKENGVKRGWTNKGFKDIYENNIKKLCLNLKFKSNNKDIDYTEMDKYFKNNHNIDESELLELLRTTNTDYSKTPSPILSQPSFISDEIIKKINSYNERNDTKYGFHISDIFALEEQCKNKRGDCKYLPKFQLEKSEDGRELLINILKMIEDSDDPMNENTIMKIAENIQNKYNSRKSNIQNPKLILIFLPMGQSINMLQKALMSFIKDNKLFKNYHYDASCSSYKLDDDADKKFLNYVDSAIQKTRNLKKRGCFLFLGDQGRIGITYPDCDITISLDNGQEISKIKQTYYRSLTEADGKTVGINFDMNIQRVYSYISYVIREYKKNNNDNRSYKEILQYLYEIEQFIFNPDELGFGNSKELVIEYFEKYEEKLKSEISSETVLENIMCDDDLGEFITQLYLKNGTIINPKLEGVKPDCPEGGKKKVKVDPMKDDSDDGDGDGDGKTDKVKDTGESDDPFFNINKTKRLYQFMTSLICLLLRKHKINPDNEHKSNSELLNIIKTTEFYKKLLLKKINDNFKISENYLNKIIDKYIEDMTSESNEYILDEIFEIYARSSPEELRKVIEKHFIPSDEQRKKNAEIPTPVELVDDMLNKIPDEYFTSENKTLEPCCGKGNFVLAIFEKYFEGLSHIENEIERCKIIIEKCIYFCDLDEMNVYITKELLICHAISKINKDFWGDWNKILEIINFKYNTYVGNTLELDIKSEWNIVGFEAVIGNPPYNSSGDTGTGNTIWQCFTRDSLNKWLNNGGYLVYVHPPGWRKPNTKRGRFFGMYDQMVKENQMYYLSMHGLDDGQKVFKCGTRYDWYVIKKEKQHTLTEVRNSDGTNKFNLSTFNWLPNSNIEQIKKLLRKDDEEPCKVLYSASSYDPRKQWMSEKKDDTFKYECIQSTNKNGPKIKFSSRNDKGFFGISKVIFGFGGINDVIVDIEGKYGMTQHAIGIEVADEEEAQELKKVLESDEFNNILQSCLFSQYIIDWCIFIDMKHYFWKEFI